MSLKERVLVALRSYASSLDIDRARQYAHEAPLELARYALEEIAAGRSSQAEAIVCLLSTLVVGGILPRAALEAGIAATFERLQDLLLDSPAALDQLSCALAWLALDGVLSENAAGTAAAAAAGDVAAAGRLLALQRLVDDWLSGSLALLQLRRVFGEALQAYLLSLDLDALQESVASVHARHASGQLVRKALQRAVHADAQQRRWLFEAIAALSGPGRMLSIDDVAAGAAAFLYALPAIAAAEDVAPAAAADAASAVLAACMAAGILPPMAVGAAAAAAGHEAAARCAAAASATAGAASAAAETAAGESGPAAAASAGARTLWGDGTVAAAGLATAIDNRLAAIAGGAASGFSAAAAAAAAASASAGMAVDRDSGSGGSGEAALGGAGVGSAAGAGVGDAAAGEADVEVLAEGLLPRSAAAADASRPVLVFRALCAALTAGEAAAASGEAVSAGAGSAAPAAAAAADVPSRLARALIYLAHTRRLRDADVARGCRAFFCSERAAGSAAPAAAGAAAAAGPAAAVRAFEFLARSGVLEPQDVGSVVRAALGVHEEGEPLPAGLMAVLARLRAK